MDSAVSSSSYGLAFTARGLQDLALRFPTNTDACFGGKQGTNDDDRSRVTYLSAEIVNTHQKPCDMISINEAMPDEIFPGHTFHSIDGEGDLLSLSDCLDTDDDESVDLSATQFLCENEPAVVDRKRESSDGSSRFASETLPSHNILSGRGGGVNFNPGNVRFMELVRSHKGAYAKAPKGNKKVISRLIVDVLQSEGRIFLSPDHTALEDKAAIKKTSGALRDELRYDAMRRTKPRRAHSQNTASSHKPAGWQPCSASPQPLPATIAARLPPPSHGCSWALCLVPVNSPTARLGAIPESPFSAGFSERRAIV
jgi:hypothetical protein